MPTTLTGSTSTDPTTAPTLSAPADGDVGSATSIQSPLQALLNDVAWLRTHLAQVDVSNTFPQAQTLQALLTLMNGIALNANAPQAITKGGTGVLTIATSGAGIFFSIGGSSVWSIDVNGNLHGYGGTIVGLPTPTNPGDAATKGYVDGKFPTPAPILASMNTNWGPGPYYWKDPVGMVHVLGSTTPNTGASSVMFTLPAGFCPAATRTFPVVDGSTQTPLVAQVTAAGLVQLYGAAPVNGHTYYLDSISFLAQQ
jgi:hypothetical protein